MIEPTIEYLKARVKDAEYTGEGRVEVAVPQLRALLADHAALTAAVRDLSAAVAQYRREDTQRVTP